MRWAGVVVPRAPQRIVVVFPGNVELAWALGLADRVVAIGGRVRWPEDRARQAQHRRRARLPRPRRWPPSSPTCSWPRPRTIRHCPLVDAFDRAKLPCVVLAHPDLPSVFRNIDLLGARRCR